jgi:hypothetical protein
VGDLVTGCLVSVILDIGALKHTETTQFMWQLCSKKVTEHEIM